MLSPRAQKFLSTLKRLTPVSVGTLERGLNEQGVPCFRAWLDFHVERCGLYMESYELGRREWPRKQMKDSLFAARALETMKPFLVPEASDRYLEYYVNDESLVAENVRTKELQLVMQLP